MRTVRTVVMLALALAIACPVLAAEKKGEKKAPTDPTAQRIQRMVEGLTLTAEQKAKLDALAKEYGPKLAPLTKKLDDVLTAEQKKTREDALKAAKDAGKKGAEAFTAASAAVKLTDDQKAKQAEIRKEMAPIQKELREKVAALLTPEQKQQFEKNAPEKKKAAK